MKFLIATTAFILPTIGRACPFCEYGGKDTAGFILSFFGLVALAATFFFILFVKKGGLKNSDHAKMSVFKAENIQLEGEKKSEKE